MGCFFFFLRTMSGTNVFMYVVEYSVFKERSMLYIVHHHRRHHHHSLECGIYALIALAHMIRRVPINWVGILMNKY